MTVRLGVHAQVSVVRARRLFAAVTDDPADGGVALFGGKTASDGREVLNGDLWLWNGVDWRLASTSTRPR